MKFGKGIKDKVNSAQDKIKKTQRDLADALAKKQKQIREQEQRIADEIKKAISKVKLAPKDAMFLPLLPFKSAMATGLDYAKVLHNNSLSDIAKKFHDHIVENGAYNKSNTLNGNVNAPIHKFGDIKKGFTHFESVDNFEDSPYFYGAKNFNADGEEKDSDTQYTEEGSTAGQYEEGAKQTKGMIQKIIAWFKARKAKKEAEKRLKDSANNPSTIDPIQVQIDQQILASDPQMMDLDYAVMGVAQQTAQQISQTAISTTDSIHGTTTHTDALGNITDVDSHKVAGFSTIEIIITLALILGACMIGFSPKK